MTGDAASDRAFGALIQQLADLKQVVVAFSGGVDSTLLAFAARQAIGGKALAVTAAPPYMAKRELEAAAALAETLEIGHAIIKIPFPESIRNNPPDRCYHCKKVLFGVIRAFADRRGIAHIADGTNADDLKDFRPGIRAVRELGIHSPLMAAGLTKAAIRALSRRFGLSTHDKPADACLLSRIPFGAAVTDGELRRIASAEAILASLGFADVRVRSHGEIARIEVPAADILRLIAAAERHDIPGRLKAVGYLYVTVDLGGYRTGSMNAGITGGAVPTA